MNVKKAVALALSYVDGVRTAGASDPQAQAQAFLENLAGQGYVVRPRNGERVRLKPEPLDRRRTSGAEIRAMCVSLGLGLGQLAEQAGISQETLAHIESGRTSPQMRTLTAILDALAAARAGQRGRASDAR